MGRILLYIFAFTFMCSCLSCKKDKRGITFHMQYNEELVIESQSIINVPFNIITPDIATNSEQEFANNDTRADKVQNITLEKLVLTIKSPSGKTFSFLKDVHIYIKADGLPENEIAYLTNVQSTSNTLELLTTDNDFSEYIKKSTYTIKTTATTKENLTQDVHMNAFMDFRVRATVI